MTTPLYYIRLNYKSALDKTDNEREKSVVFMGYMICYILVLKSFIGMSYSFFILNIDHYILLAAKFCTLLLISHGLNYKPTRIPPF